MSENHWGKPAEIACIIRRARGRPRFFVLGSTQLVIEGTDDQYLPLAPNVKVTRRHMLEYLATMQETATRQEKHRDITLKIRLSVHGSCYFV